jgi:hypothetical protein
VALVLSAFIAFYCLASALADLSPGAVDRRNAKENAAVVAMISHVYSTNAWRGMDELSSALDVTTPVSCDDPDLIDVEALASRIPSDE